MKDKDKVMKEHIDLKGTRYGVIVSMAEQPDFNKVLESLKHKFTEQQNFFKGAPVSLNLGWRELNEQQLDALLSLFEASKLHLQGIISSSFITRTIAENRDIKVIIGRLGLADHHSKVVRKERTLPGISEPLPAAVLPPPIGEHSILVRKTIRSGQKFSFSGSVVIYGDINPGAEIEAENDIFIIGALRGKAHAGYKGNTEAVIIVFNLQSLQLYIDEYIWGGNLPKKGGDPVIARIENKKIVVYPLAERRD
jgi:septum site-determining protein MinC